MIAEIIESMAGKCDTYNIMLSDGSVIEAESKPIETFAENDLEGFLGFSVAKTDGTIFIRQMDIKAIMFEKDLLNGGEEDDERI